jgi:hypothetical protein
MPSRNSREDHPQHFRCRARDAFDIQNIERHDRDEDDDDRIDDGGDGPADCGVARNAVDTAAIRPFVEIYGLQNGLHDVADDPRHHHADEEDQPGSHDARNVFDDILQQAVHRTRDRAETEYGQDHQQAEKPDQQAHDLAQRFAQRRAGTGSALEEGNIVDELGEGPFRGFCRSPCDE